MTKLTVKYGDFSYGGIDIDFYFDDVKIQSFWFSLCTDSFTSITKFLEAYIGRNFNDCRLMYNKKEIKEKQLVVNSFSEYLDGEGSDLNIKFETIRTAHSCGDGIAYSYDKMRLTLTGYETDYLNNNAVEHIMIGDAKQIIGEMYFSLMNVLGNEVFKNGHNDEYYDQNALQEYNDCKSIFIEEYLYPELEEYYVEQSSKVHLKQQLIKNVEIFKNCDMKYLLEKRKSLSKYTEIFLKNGEDVNSMKMVLPIVNQA